MICYKLFPSVKDNVQKCHFDFDMISHCGSPRMQQKLRWKKEVVSFSGYFAICSFCKENASVSVILSEMFLL